MLGFLKLPGGPVGDFVLQCEGFDAISLQGSCTLVRPLDLNGKHGHRAHILMNQKDERQPQEKSFGVTEMEKDKKERLGVSREQDFSETSVLYLKCSPVLTNISQAPECQAAHV